MLDNPSAPATIPEPVNRVAYISPPTNSPDRLQTAITKWNLLLHRQPTHDNGTDRRDVHLSPENLRNNIPWGDEMQPKQDNTFRIYCQNANGLQLDQTGGEFATMCEISLEVQADVISVTEHNLDTNKFLVRKLCHDASKRVLSHSTLTMSSSPIEMANTYKPGGTLTLSRGKLSARLINKGTDEMGRWTYQTFSGKNKTNVTIVTAYQVCDKSATQRGTFTAAAQQESLLRQRGETNPNPRKHFRLDLHNFLQQRRQDGDEIILTGDFNEALGDESDGISRLCNTFNLVDLMFTLHDSRTIPTYARGRKRLDYALATPMAAHTVIYGGYEPFNHRMASDHRAFFLDFDEAALFGSQAPRLPPIQHRDLHARNPKEVTKYLEAKYTMMESHNIFARVQRLVADPVLNPELAESIDTDLYRMSIAAGKRCQRFREPEWSIKLHEARARVGILKRVLSIRGTGYDQYSQIEALQTQQGTSFLIPSTVDECKKALRLAQTKVSQIAKQSLQHREEENIKRVTDLETDGDKKKANILRNIRKAEEMKKLFAKIRYLRTPERGHGISSIQIPTDPSVSPKDSKEWITIDAPDDVVEKLRDRNRLHFGQAHGTPFTIPPLSKDLDFDGATSSADMILDGTYDSSQLADITRMVISNLRASKYDIRAPLTTEIGDVAYTSKIKNWKESTSTSPSGMHLGHYHALIARHIYSNFDDDSLEKQELDSKQSAIRRVHLALTNYALKHGYSFQRWRTVVNIMIQKEPGNSKIHRLRVIHIYEADYNLILGLKWRELMHAAEDEEILNDGQYGSRPNRSAHDPVFIEELQSEICRASRKSNVKFDNDATSCYDRILPSFASIASRKFGIHKNVAFVMASTLQECKYKLKTLLGVSEQFYQHCSIFPIYGTGQGSGNSPALWCIISSVLFDCHASKANGATFESPDRKHTITLYMIGFVDDSTGQSNAFLLDTQPRAEILVEKMQSDAQLWNDLLWTSGGALELPKCTYHVIDYAFTVDGAPILRGGQVGGDIILQTGDRTNQHKIPFKSAHCSHKTLGHYKEPSGNQTRQYQVLIEKSNNAGIFIQCSTLNHREAWTYYFAIYLPSIGYPLPNCHFSLKQLSTIQAKGMRAIFAKCGFNRNTKSLILYGPSRLAGASFRHLYTEQGIGQILSFLKHWRCPKQPGQLLRIAVSWVQYAIGTGTSFLNDVSTHLPHLESKWLKSLRHFLHTINASIEVDIPIIQPLQRVHDCYLMDAILANDTFTPKQVCLIHYCRLYLQVLTLSDITLANGTHLDPAIHHGTHSILSSKTRMHHFRQERPSPAAWKQWQRACRLWSTPDGQLHQPLGAWLHSPKQLRSSWPAYKDIDGSLYISTPAGYDKHTRHHGIYSQQEYRNFRVPKTSVPVTLISLSTGWKISGPIFKRFQQPPLAPPGAFQDYLEALQPWESSLFQCLEMTVYPTELASLLISDSFLSASDGSVKFSNHASFGWALSLPNGRRLAKCSGPAYGIKPSSYRAEGYGMLSILRFFIQLFAYCDTQQPTNGTIACDNESLVNNVLDYQAPFPTSDLLDPEWTPFAAHQSLSSNTPPSATLAPDWDVLNEIRHSLQELRFSPTIQYIKGHQDRTTPYPRLSLLAQLNVDADTAAGEYQQIHGCYRPHVLLFPHAGAQLQIADATITYSYKSFIRNAAHGPPLLQYIQLRNHWSDTVMQCIDWTAHERAIHRSIHRRVHLTKLIHDILPTNDFVGKWQDHRTEKCPSCSHPQEDRDHVLRCPHPDRREWRRTFLLSIRQTCDKLQTRPNLRDILLTALDAWLHNTPANFGAYPSLYSTLIHQQTQIGWRQLFNGRISTEWSHLQDEYLHEQKLYSAKKTGLLWATSILTSLWDEWHLVWTIRNEAIHGHDTASRHEKERLRVENEIRAIYADRELLLPADQDHLFDDVESHLAKTTHSLRNWLNTYEGLFTDSITKAKRRALAGVRTIRSYFAPK